MTRLTAAWRGGSSTGLAGWRIQFAYDPETVEAVKLRFPTNAREWNEDGKYWWVAIEWERQLLKLFPGLEAYIRQVSLF